MARRPQLLVTSEPRVVRVHLRRFPVHISNISGGDALHCRYCRYQRLLIKDLSMPDGQRTVERWYATPFFDLAAHQARDYLAEEQSDAPWIRDVLADLIVGEQVSALLYEDISGVKYRFRPRQGTVDVWRRTNAVIAFLLRRTQPPAWVRAAETL